MISFHRILIGTAIIFCVLFAAWSFFAYSNAGGIIPLALGVAFVFAAAVLSYYLRNLDRFLRR
ncbi:MAG: hypothetical protein M3373_12265 [Gemmatimonadota bacterium]|nr:hypothetical protein [Gemmatimonadota bacterium]